MYKNLSLSLFCIEELLKAVHFLTLLNGRHGNYSTAGIK